MKIVFYKWVYKDKNGELKVTLVFYDEEGVSPYGLQLSDLGTPVQKLETQSVTLNNWKMKES